MPRVGNVNELLDGHVMLDLECLDRIYLNAYVPTLQVGGQVGEHGAKPAELVDRRLAPTSPRPSMGSPWATRLGEPRSKARAQPAQPVSEEGLLT